jgi:hypothetical protein
MRCGALRKRSGFHSRTSTRRRDRWRWWLAQLAPAQAFLDTLVVKERIAAVLTALRSRHFVTGGDALSFGVMHRLMADFVRGCAGERAEEFLELACKAALNVMTPDRCRDPRHWPVMNLCRPHAEALFERALNENATLLLSSEAALRAGILAREQADYAGARRLNEQMLQVRTRVPGEDHSDTLTSMNNLANVLLAQGDHAEERRLQEGFCRGGRACWVGSTRTP